jgi:pimeloyl-ACP methyl ester carboxylesterase
MPDLELSGGRTLSYREEGEGPPLVLVHGSPGDGRSWGRVVPHLRRRHRVFCPDLPGFGGSTRLPDESKGRTAAMGAAVARLIETCDGPVRLAGHSFGGNIALQAALQARHGTVGEVVLFEPVFFRALELTGDRAALEPAAAYFEDYARRALAGEPGAVRLMIDYWFGAGTWARMPEKIRGPLDNAAAHNAIDVRGTFLDTNTASALAAFRQPVTIIAGETSPDVVRSIARALLKLLAKARMEGLTGANDAMLDTHPEVVAGLIAA